MLVEEQCEECMWIISGLISTADNNDFLQILSEVTKPGVFYAIAQSKE
jgi:hypothetical protein